MIIIGKGVKAPANTKSTAKVAVIVGTSKKKKKNILLKNFILVYLLSNC